MYLEVAEYLFALVILIGLVYIVKRRTKKKSRGGGSSRDDSDNSTHPGFRS